MDHRTERRPTTVMFSLSDFCTRVRGAEKAAQKKSSSCHWSAAGMLPHNGVVEVIRLTNLNTSTNKAHHQSRQHRDLPPLQPRPDWQRLRQPASATQQTTGLALYSAPHMLASGVPGAALATLQDLGLGRRHQDINYVLFVARSRPGSPQRQGKIFKQRWRQTAGESCDDVDDWGTLEGPFPP